MYCTKIPNRHTFYQGHADYEDDQQPSWFLTVDRMELSDCSFHCSEEHYIDDDSGLTYGDITDSCEANSSGSGAPIPPHEGIAALLQALIELKFG